MKALKTIAVAAAAIAIAPAAFAQGKGVERMYVLQCGQGHTADMSRWTPGKNAGVAMDISDNCYLIKHAQGYFLWDTGISDAIAAMPNGQPAEAPGGIDWRRPKSLAAQLQELGVKPDDIKYVGISHTHPDHAGNVEEFPHSMLMVQKAEYDWPTPKGGPRFDPAHPVTKLDGDHDVFGDGSVTILSTPGHTPGHQSLLVKLPKTGAVLLTGDAVHFKANWDAKVVPGINFDKEKTASSMGHMADALAQSKGEIWINHDKPQSDSQKLSPQFYD